MRARPTIRCPGLIGSPDRNVVRTPRFCSARQRGGGHRSSSVARARSGRGHAAGRARHLRSSARWAASSATGSLASRIRASSPAAATTSTASISRTRRGARTCARRTPTHDRVIDRRTPRSARRAAVFTAADLAALDPTPPPARLPRGDEPAVPRRRPVRFVGEPVVAVVAETAGRRVDAAELVLVDYEPLPPSSTSSRRADECSCSPSRHEHRAELRRRSRPTSAMRGRRRGADRQPAPERGADRGPLRRRLLDGRRPARALLVVPGRARHQGDAVRGLRARARKVRVIVPDVGGGFGVKSRTYPEEPCSASTPASSAVRCAGPRPAPRTSCRCPRGAARCSTPRSAAPATAASPPTSSTWCRTPAPTRSTGAVLPT